ncbi:MAG TPA: ATP-grasp domain-containing protein [Gammaproteobacteria bacterium]|nr:ATP-grasp domain-containing protein [Gammaproteobacteria bacterium]
MDMPVIAMFADRNSEQLTRAADAVRREGGEPKVFDIQLGGASRSRMTCGTQSLVWDDMDFGDIRAIHVRCTSPNTLPTPPPILNVGFYSDWRGQFLREQEYQAAAYGFFDELAARGKLVVNPLTAGYIDHNTKSQFYAKLHSWGFDVPRTLTTNDPAVAELFIAANSEVVVKPAMGIGSTRLITPADRRRLGEFRACPVLMQERVRGHVVRAHVVADAMVLALRIRAEHVDSRTSTEGFDYYAMPGREQQRVVEATRRLGLHFAAWDLIVTNEGRHVYLDCNPGPYLLWIGPEFVAAVLTQLARYLVTYARRESLSAAAAAVEPVPPPVGS